MKVLNYKEFTIKYDTGTTEYVIWEYIGKSHRSTATPLHYTTDLQNAKSVLAFEINRARQSGYNIGIGSNSYTRGWEDFLPPPYIEGVSTNN